MNKLEFGVDDIPPHSALEFRLEKDGKLVDCFLLRHAEGYFAFENQCPHTGAPLNWQPGQFLDMENRHIQCTIHGALFRIADGHCLWGPCQGQSLFLLQVKQEGNRLVVSS
jgi:nitrite reductase/ring-hydroxylating ferredoxin subunit